MTRHPARACATFLVALALLAPAGAAPAADPPKRAVAVSSAQPDTFTQMHNRALASKAPSAAAGDSSALLTQLKKKYQGNLEGDNARVKAKFGGTSRRPLAPVGSTGSPGTASGKSAAAGDQGVEPDPCGNAFDLKAISAAPPLEPGEAVVLEGCGFGSGLQKGEIRLAGDFPGGHLKLQVSAWTPHQILAYVPMVTGVPDIPGAKIQVYRPDGKFTNWLDVGFRAARDVVKLGPSDVSLVCGVAGAQQECRLAVSYPPADASFFNGATLAARHAQSAASADCSLEVSKLKSSHADYTDQASVGLKNGWVLAGYNWWWGETGRGYVLPITGFAQDTASATLSIPWGTYVNFCMGPRNSSARYRVDLYAAGPKGIPYK